MFLLLYFFFQTQALSKLKYLFSVNDKNKSLSDKNVKPADLILQ